MLSPGRAPDALAASEVHFTGGNGLLFELRLMGSRVGIYD
jgi:hypothetical protein